MPGSTLESTRHYRAFIEQFVVEHGIRSVLDAGCGSAGFVHAIDWKGARYVGLDVVRDVIEDNRRAYPHLEFIEHDARDLEPHGGYDLLLLKDVLQHWSNEAVVAFLTQPILASFRHVLITNCDEERGDVADIRDGDWRPINLAAPPFARFGARPIARIGSKRVVHLGLRARGTDLLERFEWWIVNLDRRPDRLAYTRAQLARIGVTTPRRFQAFDGFRLQLTSCRPDWVRKGAVGCYLSHVALLKQAQARRTPCAIVEDDLKLAPDFSDGFSAFVAAVPDDWDVLLLSAGTHCRAPQVLGPEHVRLVATWGTTMAFLRLPAIDRLLEAADQLDRPIDDFYIRMMDTMNFYAPARALLSHADHLGTNIGDMG